MLPQYEPVETIGSPDGVSMNALAAEPPQPFAAASSLTTIHMQDEDSKIVCVDGSRSGYNGSAGKQSRYATTTLLQRKRKQMKTRFSDLARSRNWKLCQKILFLLGVLGVALLASFVILRFINTDEFNAIIEWIQVRCSALCVYSRSLGACGLTGACVDLLGSVWTNNRATKWSAR